MTRPYLQLDCDGPAPVLCVGDHASNRIPDGIELGVPDAVMQTHIALDIGVEGMARRCAETHGMPTHISTVSRLVCDMHRTPDDAAIVPTASDGIAIPGNVGEVAADRVARFHEPYHEALHDFIERHRPRLILALHSFTPQLADRPEPRPWQVGLLYNQDDRAARLAIELFADQGLCVGDNEPYSGKRLNATMDRHAEARGIPYLTVEVRQDLIGTRDGEKAWADRIANVAFTVLERLDTSGRRPAP